MADTLGPVELDFTIPDSFGKETDAAIKKMAGLTDAAVDMPKRVKAAIGDQKDMVKAIEGDIKELEKILKTLDAGPVKTEVESALAGSKQALEGEKTELKELEVAYDAAASGNKRLSRELSQMQDQLVRMRIAGKQNTAEYREMEAAAASLADEIADVAQVTRTLSDDQAGFKGFADGITGVTGAFAAAGGAVALFAGENKNLQKIQTKVQGLMAITIGLQQVSNTLNKDSAFMTVTVVRAKNLWAAAEARLAVALWGSTAAAKALMATLTLGIAVAIPVLISLYDKFRDKQKASLDLQREAAKITKEANIEAGKARIEIDLTISKLQKFNGSKEAEKKMIGELNKKYGDTFGTYKTLAGWLDILKTKSDEYVNVMFLQAKVQGQIAKATEVDTKIQSYIAEPSQTFERRGDGWKTTLVQGGIRKEYDPVLAKQQAEKRKADYIKALEAERTAILREAKQTQTELQQVQDSTVLSAVDPDDKKSKQTYAQKLAEVKKFYELYAKAIELGQSEAAAIFKKKLPDAATYQEYITSELLKANKAGNLEKTAALIPEQEGASKAFKDLLNEFKTYTEKRTGIETKYNEKIVQLTQKGYTEKAKIAADARDKELAALDDAQPLNKLLIRYKTYRTQVEEITAKSNAEIKAMRDAGYGDEAKLAEVDRDKQIQELILKNEFETYTQIGEMGKKELEAFMQKIKIKIDLMRAEGKAVDELEKVYNKAQAVLKGSGKTEDLGDKFKAASQILGTMANQAGQLNSEFADLVGLAANLAGSLGDAMSALKKGGKGSAAAFSGVVSIVMTVADQLDKQFGMQARIAKMEEERERYNDGLIIKIESINREIEKQLKLMDRLTGSQKAEEYAESFDLLKRKIEESEAILNNMQFEFVPAPKNLDQTIGIDVMRLVSGAADDFEAIQFGLANGWITEEQANIAKDYLDTIEKLKDQSYELQQQQIELLTQTNAVQLADQLADALTQAAIDGTDAMVAWGEVTDQVLRNAVKNALKMKLLNAPIEAAIAQLADDMKDGLTPEEQAAFRASMEEAGKNYTQALQEFPDLFGGEDNNNLNGSLAPDKNMFSGMTQQTGSELLGQFTALRMSAAGVNDILNDERHARIIMRQSLEAIAENTSYCRKLEDIDRTLKVLETDGIKVR